MASSVELSNASGNASAMMENLISVMHLTECQLSQIKSIKDGSCDFSHVPAALSKLLVGKPNHCLYMYATPSCCDTTGANAKQALVLTAIVLPKRHGPPTSTALRYNNQRASEEKLIPFESLGYSWKELTDDLMHDPSLKGKLFYLAHEADLEDTDIVHAHDHEYSTPYLVSREDLKTTKNGKLCLKNVNFSSRDCNGDKQRAVWDCSVKFEDCVDELYHGPYQPMDEDNPRELRLTQYFANYEAAGKAYLETVISKAVHLARVKKEEYHTTHFESVEYTRRQVQKLQCSVIFPANYSASIGKPVYSGRCVDAFSIYITDHHSLSDASLRSQLPSTALKKLDTAKEKLRIVLFVDFADGIRHEVNSNAALDALVNNYSNRILQYIGSKSGVQYLRDLVDECKRMISKVGRFPHDARDFVLNFLFDLPRLRNSTTLHDQAQPESIRVNSSWVLEVKCFGGSGYRQISTAALKKCLSDEGITSSILQLLCGSKFVQIPAGAREDDHESASPGEQQPQRDCFKASLLLAPFLTPFCKKLIERHLPNYEIPFPQISDLLRQKVKLVSMTRVRDGIHEFAMTEKCMMIGVFVESGGNLQHSVFIDGTDGPQGSISDPLPEYEKKMARCEATLEKLGITEFSSVFIIKQVEVNKKKMRAFRKTLNSIPRG